MPNASASENWWIASYSALRISDVLTPAAMRRRTARRHKSCFDDERLDPEAPREIIAGRCRYPSISPWARIPAHFSTACWSGQVTKALPWRRETAKRWRCDVARRCNLRGWEGWINTLTDWLQHLLSHAAALAAMQSIA
jgi:exodeoxyribonuclease V beta subunit